MGKWSSLFQKFFILTDQHNFPVAVPFAYCSQPFKDMPVHLSGDFIATGAAAPDFELVKTDLGTLSLSSLKGKRVILNIFPSLDTGVCAMSVRKFNQLAASLPDTVVLAISKDLPFAHARFCTVEGIENLVPLSDFRHSDFDENYGVLMADGPLQGLLARSVVVIDTAAVSCKFQPRNGIECTPFIDIRADDELGEMTPFLEYLSKKPVGVAGERECEEGRQFVRMWKDTRVAQSQLVVYGH